MKTLHRSLAGLLLPAVLVPALLAPRAGAADVAGARERMRAGAWAEAEKELRDLLTRERGTAHLALAEVCFVTGRYPEALDLVTEASLRPELQGPALTLAAQIQLSVGKTDDALKLAQGAAALAPPYLPARVLTGRILGVMGRLAPGEKLPGERTFRAVVEDFNAGRLDRKEPDVLVAAGFAARHLGLFQDAADLLQDALEIDAKHQEANLELAELFLAKYRADEAATSFQEVLKVNKNLPRALAGMGAAALEASYDVPRATRLADQALAVNPSFGPALRLKARIALDDEKYEDGGKLVDQALAVNPADLEALALRGARAYLQDDPPGFDAARAQALKLNPRYGNFFHVVGELAVRHHRYREGVELYRQGRAVEPENSDVLSALGANLLRLGMAAEPEGRRVLDEAFKRDPFNVRTFNTLKLYEEVIDPEYVTVPGSGTFVYRFPKAEAPVLSRHVPPALKEAWDLYVGKYGFTPETPITVELFAERQHYGARTIGLPELGAQGTCFGKLITAMSPSSAEANWDLVLSHELAHVFHLQLSRNRVSRWFTEGLCEYETNVRRPYWKREHARDVYVSLLRGDLWKIGELSTMFVRPNRPNGVVIAYQQSSMVIHFLAESYGFPSIVRALKLYGEGKDDAAVLQAITGRGPSALDAEFAAWMRRKYAHYAAGFFFAPSLYDAETTRKAAMEKPGDARAQAEYAAALLEEAPEAVEQARKSLAVDPKQPLARFVLATALLKTGEADAARTEYQALLDAGVDGYDIRFALGRIAAARDDVPQAVEHLNKAKTFDPDEADPHRLLMQLYEKKEMRDELLREAEAYLELEEHDHAAAKLLLDRLALDERWEDLARVAPRVIGITPNEAFTHHMYGIAQSRAGRAKEAAFSLETALAIGVRRPGPVRGLLAKQYLALGDRAKAKQAAEQALKETPNNADAKQVLMRLGSAPGR